MRIELMNTTEHLLREINEHKLIQKEVALSYAMSICSSEKTNWPKVNLAIIERWSNSGLIRVKEMAWKIIDKKSHENN